MEEEAGKAARPQLWAMGGREREALGGTCLPGLQLVAYDGLRRFADGARHCYLFSRHVEEGGGGPPLPLPGAATAAVGEGGCSGRRGLPGDASVGPQLPPSTSSSSPTPAAATPPSVSGGSSLLSCAFAPGDMALLGVEGRHPALARVTVAEATQVRADRVPYAV